MIANSALQFVLVSRFLTFTIQKELKSMIIHFANTLTEI